MACYISEAQVRELVEMPDALAITERVFAELATGAAENLPRQRLYQPRGTMHHMMAALPSLAVMGHKVYTTYPEGSRFHVYLYHTETGDLLAIIEAIWHGLLRTAAASGVATKYLARRDAGSVGVIGSGAHARTQLEAVCAVRPIRGARVYSPTPAHRQRYAEEMTARLGIEVVPAESAEAAVRGMEIVITATKSPAPVLRGDWLAPGAHLNAMGSNSLLRRELDPLTVERAALVVADSVEQLRLEGGDLLASISTGKLRWGQIVPLGSIVAGFHPGRQSETDITLFKSSGLGAQDVALGAVIYERALQRGIGTELSVTPL